MTKRFVAFFLCMAMILTATPVMAISEAGSILESGGGIIGRGDTPGYTHVDGYDAIEIKLLGNSQNTLKRAVAVLNSVGSDSGPLNSKLTLAGTGSVQLVRYSTADRGAYLSTPVKANANIVIEQNSNITMELMNVHLISRDALPTIEVGYNSTLTLVIKGNNTLSYDSQLFYGNKAASTIALMPTAKLIIQRAGVSDDETLKIENLKAGAGIGGLAIDYYKDKPHGEVIINSGKVDVIGAQMAAAIGGTAQPYFCSDGGNVTINGGMVTVDSSASGYGGCAAIGGATFDGAGGDVGGNGNGGTVTLNGGVLTAIAATVSQPSSEATKPMNVIGAAVGEAHAGAGNNTSRLYINGGMLKMIAKGSNTFNDDNFYYDGQGPNPIVYPQNAVVIKEHWRTPDSGTYTYTTGSGTVYGNANIKDIRTKASVSLEAGLILDIPKNQTLTIGANTCLYVRERITGEIGSLMTENGGSIVGSGKWPGNEMTITVPETNPPTAEELETLESSGKAAYLAVVEDSSENKSIVKGNSIAQLSENAAGGTLLNVFNAGKDGFELIDPDDSTKGWKTTAYQISLVNNGTLGASRARGTPLFTIVEDGGTVTATGQNLGICSPSYTVFSPKTLSATFEMVFPAGQDMSSSEKAVTATFDSSLNAAVISVPEIFGSSFSLESVSALRSKRALRFGGTLRLNTPISDIAGIEINQLQLDFNGSSVMLGGLEAGGHVSIPKIGGFVGGGASVDINTFSGEGYFNFELELDTPVIDAEFQLEFKEARGVWLPNALYLHGNTNQAGIPLVPPTVVAYITGLGLGVYGLADTVAMTNVALPPLRLRMTGDGSLVDMLNATIDMTVGPGYTEILFTDVEIENVTDVIEEIGSTIYTNLEQYDYRGKTYTALAHHQRHRMLVKMEIIGNKFFEAYGEIGFDAYAGLCIESPQAHLLARIQSSGKLGGSMFLPKNILLFFPFKDLDFGSVDARYHLAGTARSTIEYRNAADAEDKLGVMFDGIDVEGSISATARMDAWLVKFWARASYIFGGDISLDAGMGDAPDELGALPSGRYAYGRAQKADEFTATDTVTDPDTGEEMVVALQTNATVVANTARRGTRTMAVVGAVDNSVPLPKGVTIAMSDAEDKVYTVNFNGLTNEQTQSILFVTETIDGTSQTGISVTQNGIALTLTQAAYNTDGTLSNADVANYDSSGKYTYFKSHTNQAFTIAAEKPVNIRAIQFKPYATLSSADTSISSATVNYTIDDYDSESSYAVQAFIGSTQGALDFPVGSTDTTSEGAFVKIGSSTGNFSVATSGGLVPTGDYHLTVALMEKTTVAVGDSEITRWIVADTRGISDSYHYENSATVTAPNVTGFTYAGNSTLKADWDAVSDVNGYSVMVYESNGTTTTPTGISYEFTKTPIFSSTGAIIGYEAGDIETEVTMDLSKDFKDANNETIEGLSTNKDYKFGVRAFKNVEYTLGDGTTQAGIVYSVESMSDAAELKAATPPVLTYSANVYIDDNNLPTVMIPTAGGVFTVNSTETVDFSAICNTSGVAITAPASGTGGDFAVSLTWPTGDSVGTDKFAGGSFEVEIKATDADGDYAVQRINVMIDDAAPTIMLDALGKFVGNTTDGGIITGRAEAGAMVMAWTATGGGAASPAASTRAQLDGSFRLAVASTGTFAVDAVDGSQNRSVALKATVENGTTVSPENVTYTWSPLGFTLQPASGVSIAGVKLVLDRVTLVEGADYSTDINSYMLSDTLLAGLTVGLHTIKFDMPTGNDPTAVIEIVSLPPVAEQQGGRSGGGRTTISVLIDGVEKDIAETENTADGPVITLKEDEVQALFENAKDSLAIVTNEASAKVKVPLGLIPTLVENGMDLEFTAGDATYSIPAAALGDRLAQAGNGKEKAYLVLSIAPAGKERASKLSKLAADRGAVTVGGALEFETYLELDGEKTPVERFERYVKRIVRVTEAQAKLITTAVVLDENGLRHVPTKLLKDEGQWYAVISSLTNSTYGLISFKPELKDLTGKWYQETTEDAASRIIVSGVGGGTFDGDRSITRAEFSAMLVRALGIPSEDGPIPFKDVKATDWYAGVVLAMYDLGITNGKGGGTTFAANEPITRQDAMLMLMRAASVAEYEATPVQIGVYYDLGSVDSYAKDAMYWNLENGFIQGTAGYVRPKKHITRAESMAIIMRLLQKTGLIGIEEKTADKL